MIRDNITKQKREWKQTNKQFNFRDRKWDKFNFFKCNSSGKKISYVVTLIVNHVPKHTIHDGHNDYKHEFILSVNLVTKL